MNIYFTLIEGIFVVLKFIVLIIGYRFNVSNVCEYVIYYIYYSFYRYILYNTFFVYINFLFQILVEMDMFNLIYVLK